MKNNIADFVAASMDKALKSQQYKSLFKLASDADGHEHSDECDCDEGMAKDKPSEECFECEFDVSFKDEDGEMQTKKVSVKEDSMKDFEKSLKKAVKEMKGEDDEDEEEEEDDDKALDQSDPTSLYGLSNTTAFDVAIDSLLTASAALDEIGMGNSSTLSVKLASIVVEAKGKSAKDKVTKEMAKQDKELDKTRLKEKKDAATAATKANEKKEKIKLQKAKDAAKAKAIKEMDKKEKAEKSAKVRFK